MQTLLLSLDGTSAPIGGAWYSRALVDFVVHVPRFILFAGPSGQRDPELAAAVTDCLRLLGANIGRQTLVMLDVPVTSALVGALAQCPPSANDLTLRNLLTDDTTQTGKDLRRLWEQVLVDPRVQTLTVLMVSFWHADLFLSPDWRPHHRKAQITIGLDWLLWSRHLRLPDADSLARLWAFAEAVDVEANIHTTADERQCLDHLAVLCDSLRQADVPHVLRLHVDDFDTGLEPDERRPAYDILLRHLRTHLEWSHAHPHGIGRVQLHLPACWADELTDLSGMSPHLAVYRMVHHPSSNDGASVVDSSDLDDDDDSG